MKRIAVSLVLAVVASLLCGCATNSVANYLDNSEVQFAEETERATLVQAFNDALTLSAEELAARRYPDYQGNPRQWELRTLIERHVMPDAQGKSLGEDFYSDIKSPPAQERIRQILNGLAP